MSDFQAKIGEAMVQSQAMTQDQCEIVLAKQKNGDERKFGEIAIELGYIDFQTLISFLQNQGKA